MGLSTGSTSQALSFIENLMIEPPIPRESVAQGFTIPDIKKQKGIMFLLTKFLFNAGYIPVSAPEEFGNPNTLMLFPVAVTPALDSFGM